MTLATATLIRELLRHGRGALASVEKWVNAEQSQVEMEVKSFPEIQTQSSRPELKQ
jgi:hypothetical protein